MGWNYWNNMMGGYGMVGGGLLALLLLIALIVVVVLLVRSSRNSGGAASGSATPTPGAQRETAIEVLEMRYARGEIDREEYEARRRDLERTSTL